MTHRYRIFFGVLTLALAIQIVGGIATYVYLRGALFDEARRKALAIVTTAASVIDGDELEQVGYGTDVNSESYMALQAKLRHIRDTNRGDDLYTQYVYTMRESPLRQGAFEFGVDAEEDYLFYSRPGEVYRRSGDVPIDFTKPYVDNDFIVDDWGSHLSAMAPVKSKDGRIVGGLGIDVSADSVVQSVRRSEQVFLLIFLAMLALSAVGSLFLSRRMAGPVESLHAHLRQLLPKDTAARLSTSQPRSEYQAATLEFAHVEKMLVEREKLTRAMAAYISSRVLDVIMNADTVDALAAKRHNVSILFADIRDFTTIAEDLPPETVATWLNEYYSRIVEVAEANQVSVIKFLGDGALMIFGAPNEDPYKEEHAIRTALGMRDILRDVSAKWQDVIGKELRIGIGISTGYALVGNLGSASCMDYSAIGDNVNVAARLEQLTKQMDAEILVSGYTFNAVRHQVDAIEKGSINLKGRDTTVSVFEVLAIHDDEQTRRGTSSASALHPA